MPGFFSPHKTDIFYSEMYSWYRAPKVWGAFFKCAMIFLVVGIVLATSVMGSAEKEAKRKAEVSTPCATSAPK